MKRTRTTIEWGKIARSAKACSGVRYADTIMPWMLFGYFRNSIISYFTAIHTGRLYYSITIIIRMRSPQYTTFITTCVRIQCAPTRTHTRGFVDGNWGLLITTVTEIDGGRTDARCLYSPCAVCSRLCDILYSRGRATGSHYSFCRRFA